MIPAEEANRRYFRRAYSTGRHGWEADKPSRYALALLEKIRKHVPKGTLLDLGCGEGRHSIAAAGLGFKVVGVDYEPLALKRAKKATKKAGVTGISFRKADVFDLPYPGSTFDVVLDYGCLHHQKKADWAVYRAGILKVMKRHAFLVLSVFSPRFRMFSGSQRKWHIAQGAYRRCFTRGDITSLFGSDFDILEIFEQKGHGGGFWHTLMKRRSHL